MWSCNVLNCGDGTCVHTILPDLCPICTEPLVKVITTGFIFCSNNDLFCDYELQENNEMKRYIGTKVINAKPVTRQVYNDMRGWNLPDDEDGDDEGFLVELIDEEPNLDGYEGYVSWSPKDLFNNTYQEVSGLSFGIAIDAMKAGLKVSREGWNGKNMFIVYMEPLHLPPFNTTDTNRKVNDRTAKWIGEDAPLDCQPYIAMYNAQKQWIPGWVASQSDMLSNDWRIVE